MTPKQLMVADGAPKALFLTPEQRNKAWQGVPLRTPVFAQIEKRDEDEATKAFRAQMEEERRQKSLAGIQRMKNRFAAKAIDYSKMRWDARRNKFVPIDVGTPGSVPAVKTSRPDSAVARVRETTPAGTDNWIYPAAPKFKFPPKATDGHDWSRITKDTAEKIAKLNSAWKPEYEKLRGTGRIVMTIGNILKGRVKRGETIKWT